MIPKRRTILLITLPIVALIIPLISFWLLVGRAPSISPLDAYNLLTSPQTNAIIVDIRDQETYQTSHLVGAYHWPLKEIQAIGTSQDIPPELRDRTILLICDSGVSSAAAVLKLQGISNEDVYNVSGGMQSWIAVIGELKKSEHPGLQLSSGDIIHLPYRESSSFFQWAAVISGFVIKPLYMLGSAVLIFIFVKRKEYDLRLLMWSMVFFLLGEAFCSINYIFFNEQSLFFEFLHSFGMVLSMSFSIMAIIDSLDHRIIGYTDPDQKCALLSLCVGCYKYKEVPCGLNRLFKIAIVAFCVLTFIPITTTSLPVSYNTSILGNFYNYSHAGIHQLYEIQTCPLIALVLFLLGFIALNAGSKQGIHLSKLFLGFGLGHLGFSFFRMVLLHPFQNNMVWFVVWEEVTEFIFIAGAAAFLLIFKDRLLMKQTINKD